MVEIPDHLMRRKPVLISKTRLTSTRYQKNIDEIIEWLVDVDDYDFSQKFEEFQKKSSEGDSLLEFEKLLREQNEVTDPEILTIYSKCLKYRSDLKIKELLKFLSVSLERKRGRPRGKNQKTRMLDIGVQYYRRLRKILKAQYGIEAKDALLAKVSNEWSIDQDLLAAHLRKGNFIQ